jgi:hypothetical protein
MTSKKAVERIMKVLGLTSQKFYESTTEQGMMMKMEGELELGMPIYMATEEGLIPAPPGVHKMEDGSEIEVDEEGMVSKIKMGATADAEKEIKDEEEDITNETMSVDGKFADVKLKDGSILRIGADEPQVGTRVLKVNYDNTLTAITDGEYETSDGRVISIDGGAIQGVQSKTDYDKRATGTDLEKKVAVEDIKEAEALVFTEAKTVEGGIKLDSPTFDVGETIDVIKDDGTKEKAPNGEHEIILKDSEGSDVKIRVQVADGKITQRENVEEPSKEDEMAEIASMFALALKKFETKIDAIASKQTELETKFGKFSKEPAGSRVFTQKTINEKENPLQSKYEAFRKMREMIKN